MILSTLPPALLASKNQYPQSPSPSARVSPYSSSSPSPLSFLSSNRSFSLPRPSLSTSLAFRSTTAQPPRSASGRRALSSLHVNAMAELVRDNEVVASGSGEEIDEVRKLEMKSHCRTFLDAKTEEELLSGICREAEAGRLPSNVAAGMEELYKNYKNAVLQSGIPSAHEIIISNMAVALDRIILDVEDPFNFSPYHKALREPFDYYNFGQNYIRPLVDFRNSYVGNVAIFKKIEDNLQQGHNVVFISNHQTEADPAIIALSVETTNPLIAENLIYVAGDRVVTDPLCKPFSMGRNLICVFSRKHMHDDPELVEMKKKANIRSLKEMAVLFRGGSKIVWIAPSGGRDRPDPRTGEWYPAPFDASSVDNIRRLAEHSGAPAHIYPLALLCHDIMPPPAHVEKEIGERREISFHGTGVSIAPEVSYSEVSAGCENPEEAKNLYSQVLYNSVIEQYDVLKSAIHGKQGLQASTPTISLSQPWM